MDRKKPSRSATSPTIQYPYNMVKSLHATLPPHQPFPPELTKKIVSSIDIGNLIGIKKVRFNKPSNPTNTKSSSTGPIRPLLGMVISKDSIYGDLLNNTIRHVCIANNSFLPIFGRSDHLCISLHELRSSPDENHTIARQIDLNHRTLHDPSQYTILRHIRINCKIISKNDLYLRQAIGSFGNCIGLFLNFTNGPADLQLTSLPSITRNLLPLPSTPPSHIKNHRSQQRHHQPHPRLTHHYQPPPQTLRSPIYLSPRGRGRNGHNNTPPRPPLSSPLDSSSALSRISRTSNLSIRSNNSHKYYVIINGVGDIAVANIHP